MLVDYLIKYSKLNFSKHINKSVSWHTNMAEDWNVNFPGGELIDNMIAGTDRLQSCMKRHKNLMLRKHENTSLQGHCVQYNKSNGIYRQLLAFT
jgi:hypothetical protein